MIYKTVTLSDLGTPYSDIEESFAFETQPITKNPEKTYSPSFEYPFEKSKELKNSQDSEEVWEPEETGEVFDPENDEVFFTDSEPEFFYPSSHIWPRKSDTLPFSNIFPSTEIYRSAEKPTSTEPIEKKKFMTHASKESEITSQPIEEDDDYDYDNDNDKKVDDGFDYDEKDLTTTYIKIEKPHNSNSYFGFETPTASYESEDIDYNDYESATTGLASMNDDLENIENNFEGTATIPTFIDEGFKSFYSHYKSKSLSENEENENDDDYIEDEEENAYHKASSSFMSDSYQSSDAFIYTSSHSFYAPTFSDEPTDSENEKVKISFKKKLFNKIKKHKSHKSKTDSVADVDESKDFF